MSSPGSVAVSMNPPHAAFHQAVLMYEEPMLSAKQQHISNYYPKPGSPHAQGGINARY